MVVKQFNTQSGNLEGWPVATFLFLLNPYFINLFTSHALDCEWLVISPSTLDVKAADKRSVLGIVIYILWLPKRAHVCFRRHLVQWGAGAASSDLPE